MLVFSVLVACGEDAPEAFDESTLTPQQYQEWQKIKKERDISDQKLWVELKANPPTPPWIAYPGHERYDVFWRMGVGEDHIAKLYVYFKNSPVEVRKIFESEYPVPKGWEGWHDE